MKRASPGQAETLVRLMELADAPHNLEAFQYVVFQFDFKEYEQFIIECPPGSIRFNNLLRVAVFCDNLGYLVEGESVDREAVYEVFPIPWAKVEPIILGMRRELDWPDAFDYFERLGHDYVKWWEAKRKRIKPLPPLPPSTSAPRSLTVARSRAPLPSRPVVPPRTAPTVSPVTAAAAARAASPPAGAPPVTKPALRVLAKPALKLGGKPVKVVEGKGPSRPASKAKAKAKPKPKAKPKAKASKRR